MRKILKRRVRPCSYCKRRRKVKLYYVVGEDGISKERVPFCRPCSWTVFGD